MMACEKWYLLIKLKNVVKVGPHLTKLSGSAHGHNTRKFEAQLSIPESAWTYVLPGLVNIHKPSANYIAKTA